MSNCCCRKCRSSYLHKKEASIFFLVLGSSIVNKECQNQRLKAEQCIWRRVMGFLYRRGGRGWGGGSCNCESSGVMRRWLGRAPLCGVSVLILISYLHYCQLIGSCTYPPSFSINQKEGVLCCPQPLHLLLTQTITRVRTYSVSLWSFKK